MTPRVATVSHNERNHMVGTLTVEGSNPGAGKAIFFLAKAALRKPLLAFNVHEARIMH